MPLPKETDLFPHLKEWLEAQGYTVRAEVKGCDIAAVKDGRLVLVEIKRTINLELVYQIIRRQAADALVYGAIIAPKEFDKRWREGVRLFKRLQAGLILVYMDETPRVELLLHPEPQRQGVRRNTTKAYLREMSGRTVETNVGGSPGWNTMTAMREKALAVAVALERFGPSPKHLLCLTGASSMTGSILRRNRDGWFCQVSPGVYGLTEAGEEALRDYPTLVEVLRQRVAKIRIGRS